MAQQTITSNQTQPLGGPNTGTGTDQGDLWDTVVTKINAMFSDIYQGARAMVAGGGTATYAPSGNIVQNVAQIGSSATNTTQTLMSYVLPASTLKTVGQGLMITAWGTFAGNAAGKTLQLTVGGQNINTGSVTQSGSTWILQGEVFKTAANAQTDLFTAQLGTVFVAPKAVTDTSTDTGTISIAVTILDASAGQSNVLENGLTIEFYP